MALSKIDTSLKALPKLWPIICISNLLIGCFIGLMMRYKLIYPLPFVSQTQMLNGHENLMFNGWVGLTLFACIVSFVLPVHRAKRKKYFHAFYALETGSLGMFFSFLIGGYNPFSIFFILFTIATTLYFIIQIWKDLNSKEVSTGVSLFLKGGMIWYVLSIPGIAILIYFNLSGKGTPFTTRAALYYYLHFQYNGWFTFCIFALLLRWLTTLDLPLTLKTVKIIFWLLTIGLIPGYFLSILAFYPYIWVEIPSIISVVTYFAAAIILFRVILKIYPHLNLKTPTATNLLWKIATLIFFLKTMMQAATLFPSLASFAFAYRPLIIGFLHLTFLGFVSFFLIGYLLFFDELKIKKNRLSQIGLILFVACVLLSEIGLFLQSFLAYIGQYPFIMNIIEFWITGGIFLGLLFFVGAQFKANHISLVDLQLARES